MLIGYVFFTLIACSLNWLIRSLNKSSDLSYAKVIQISNAGFGASLMVTFLGMMFIPQFDISAEEKTLYLFYVFAISYLLIILFSLYSQLSYQQGTTDETADLDEENKLGADRAEPNQNDLSGENSHQDKE